MYPLKKLPRSFYLRPTLMVAKALLGKFLVRRLGSTLLVARIVEAEAYLGAKDPASHAYRGRTPRNEVMFRRGGHLYVYFTYGMHFCANVVTEGAGIGHAVLLRAGEPIAGLALMQKNRSGGGKTFRVEELCSGPARLCQALGIGRSDNGMDLCGRTIWIAGLRGETGHVRVTRSTRVGITRGLHHKWRFSVAGSRFVSRTKPVDPR